MERIKIRRKWKIRILGVAKFVVQRVYINIRNSVTSHVLKAVSTVFDGTSCVGEISGASIFHSCRKLFRTSSWPYKRSTV